MPVARTPIELLAEELGAVAGQIEREARAEVRSMREACTALVADLRRTAIERELDNAHFRDELRAVAEAQMASVRDGQDGQDGQDGHHGIDGERGERGPPGERGLVGERGAMGVQGERGLVGERGERGPLGERGLVGERGEPGVQGERGLNGLPGLLGPPGPQGPPGDIPLAPPEIAEQITRALVLLQTNSRAESF